MVHQICNLSKYKNRHSSKRIIVIKLSFCQTDVPLEDHFGKSKAWSHVKFLNYVYFVINPSRKFDAPSTTLYKCIRSCADLVRTKKFTRLKIWTAELRLVSTANPSGSRATMSKSNNLGWFSDGICKYKLGYKSHDLL